MPLAATWMDLEIIILSKSDKDKYHMISFICGIYFLKNDANEYSQNVKQTYRYWKQTYGYQRGKVVERDKSGLGMNTHILLYIR